jgi:hypothetical protein
LASLFIRPVEVLSERPVAGALVWEPTPWAMGVAHALETIAHGVGSYRRGCTRETGERILKHQRPYESRRHQMDIGLPLAL